MFSYEDNYGGNVFDNLYYSYLFFRENHVFIFTSSPMFSTSKLKPLKSFDDIKTLKNLDVILKNATRCDYRNVDRNIIEFNLPIQTENEIGEIIEVTRIYKAILENNNKSLILNAWNENTPGRIEINEGFEQIKLINEKSFE